jgi:hypothetical protein
MTLPTVHLNGTSRDELVRQQKAVIGQAWALREALHDAMPNGRDFYPHGPDVINEAVQKHREKLIWCENLITECNKAIESIMDQGA